MRLVRLAEKFRMELAGDKERMVRQFDDFHEFAVGRETAENEARLLEAFAVGVVEFVAVPVALDDDECAVSCCAFGPITNWQGCAPRRIVPPFLVTRFC